MASRLVGAAVTIESERASPSRWPLPRIFSLKKAVLLVPSVIDAKPDRAQVIEDALRRVCSGETVEGLLSPRSQAQVCMLPR